MFKQFARRISNELTHLSSNSKAGTTNIPYMSLHNNIIISLLVRSHAKAIASSYFKKRDKFSGSEDLHYLNDIICNQKLK